RHIFASGGADRLVPRETMVERARGDLEQADAALPAAPERVVVRSGVDADHLEGPVELLPVHRLQAGAERRAAVEGRDDARGGGFAHHGRPHAAARAGGAVTASP